MFFTPQIKAIALVAGATAALVACKPAQDTTSEPAAPVIETPAASENPAGTPATTISGPWAGLAPMVGQYPRDSGLLSESPIVADLKTLLGDKYDMFVANMATQAPLQTDGDVLFTSGNKPHEGGTEAAYLIIDPAKTTLEAGLWEKGKLTTFTTQGATLKKPEDIQAMISNTAS